MGIAYKARDRETHDTAALKVLQPEIAAHPVSLEFLLMTLSVALAATGVALAYYFFLKNREAADRVATSWSGVHRLLQNKYYVDELTTLCL